MEGLAPVDGWAVAAILAKAGGYLAALLALGGPLFVALFPEAPETAKRTARTVATAAALIGLAILATRFGIRAARISGMGPAGMVDPIMLGIVWDSPLGWAAVLRGVGAMMVLAVLIKGRTALTVALGGAALMSASYATVGHSLGDPRWILASLLVVHLLAVGFWVASLAPLYRATYHAQGPALLHRFGHVASIVVGALIVAGMLFALLMTGSVNGLLTTAYGATLLVKLSVVAGLLCLAAHNKLRLVPALSGGDNRAAPRLRRAIRWEGIAIALILLATATLTSVTTPPVNL